MTISSQWLASMQQRWRELGVYTLPIDGDFGPGCEAAIDRLTALAEKAAGVASPRYAGLPAAYRWLSDISPLPLTIHEGLTLLGTKEVSGRSHSPVIMGWAGEVGAAYPSDETAWCGLFAAVVARRASKDFGGVENVLGARQWIKFGEAVDRPGLGDVLVFWRGSRSGWQGHVGFYIGEDATTYHVLGGNQGNTVSIARMTKDRLLGARRPSYRNAPATVKPYLVAATGRISTDES